MTKDETKTDKDKTVVIKRPTQLYAAINDKPDKIILEGGITEIREGKIEPISNIDDILMQAGFDREPSQTDTQWQITYVRYDNPNNSQ